MRFINAGIFEYDRRQPAKSGPRVSAPSDALTPREIEVMRLLATGLTKHETADQLHMSVRTAENHKQNAMEKIGSRRIVRALIMGGFLIPTGGPQL